LGREPEGIVIEIVAVRLNLDFSHGIKKMGHIRAMSERKSG